MPTRRTSPALLVALAFGANLACDAVLGRWTATAPPWLLLRFMDEAFRDFLNPVGVALGASVANGMMAALLALALEGAPRGRARKLALALGGLSVASGALLIAIYVRPPWPIALGSLAALLPRAAVVAWALDRAMPRRAPAAAPAP